MCILETMGDEVEGFVGDQMTKIFGFCAEGEWVTNKGLYIRVGRCYHIYIWKAQNGDSVEARSGCKAKGVIPAWRLLQ